MLKKLSLTFLQFEKGIIRFLRSQNKLSSTSQECVFLLLSKKNYIHEFYNFAYVEIFFNEATKNSYSKILLRYYPFGCPSSTVYLHLACDSAVISKGAERQYHILFFTAPTSIFYKYMHQS